MRIYRLAAAGLVLAAVGVGLLGTASSSSSAPFGFTTSRLEEADGGTEPRVTIAPDGTAYVVTNAGGTATVYASTDRGAHWARRGDLAAQDSPTIDVDIVALPTGRLVANELDFAGINIRNSYSDDGGRTWTAAGQLSQLADTDRQWVAVGPVDPATGKNRVYLLWHNLLTGFANHNMWVQTSNDGGATFGVPVPTTMPGQDAYADLQCADSGGPSGIAVNQQTGQIYVAFGTRSGTVGGGCGASVDPGPLEVNIVNATRVWVATSPDNSPGSWTQSMVVDRTDTGQVVGMQLSPLALDNAGNVYVTYPESKDATDFTASINYRWAKPDLAEWSAPVTVAALEGAGNILPHVIAGDPGRLGFAYYQGQLRGAEKSQWYSMVAQTLDGQSAHPTFVRTQLSPIPTYSGTAAELMGICGTPGPAQGVENGFLCDRSTDVYGITIDARGYLYTTWPTVGSAGDGAVSGTYVSAQTSGASLYAGKVVAPPVSKPPAKPGTHPAPQPGRGPLAATGLPTVVAVLALVAVGTGLAIRRFGGLHHRD